MQQITHISMTSKDCSGCTACQAVCAKQAISFVSDEEGFKIPQVEETLCVECGLCVKTCPAINNKDVKTDWQSKAFALQYHDEPVRMNSASGGLFPAFANYYINTLHGYVCGCVMDEELTAKHIVSNRWEDIERMQDSKYVQSDMGRCMTDIVKLLRAGQHVLFTGTSCQVNGLLFLLDSKKIDRSNLLTIDFFCHGVPSPKVWKDYVHYYEKIKGSKMEGYRFRNKTYGWGKGAQSRGTGFLSTWQWKGTQHEDFRLIARIWPRIFFSNLCLRSYCHNCPYTKVDKPADITMGDFWGVEDFRPNFDDHKGCSMAITHSEKAESILKKLENTEILEVSIDEVIKKQGNAFAPSRPHCLRDEFWSDYNNGGIPAVLPKYFFYTGKGRLKAFVKFVLFKIHLRKYSY